MGSEADFLLSQVYESAPYASPDGRTIGLTARGHLEPIQSPYAGASNSEAPYWIYEQGYPNYVARYTEAEAKALWPLDPPAPPGKFGWGGGIQGDWDARMRYNDYINYVNTLPAWQQQFYYNNIDWRKAGSQSVKFFQNADGSIGALFAQAPGDTAQDRLAYVQNNPETDLEIWRNIDPNTGKATYEYYEGQDTGGGFGSFLGPIGGLVGGLIAAPFTGGMSLLGSAALMGGATAGGNLLGQAIGGDVNWGQVGMAGLGGALSGALSSGFGGAASAGGEAFNYVPPTGIEAFNYVPGGFDFNLFDKFGDPFNYVPAGGYANVPMGTYTPAQLGNYYNLYDDAGEPMNYVPGSEMGDTDWWSTVSKIAKIGKGLMGGQRASVSQPSPASRGGISGYPISYRNYNVNSDYSAPQTANIAKQAIENSLKPEAINPTMLKYGTMNIGTMDDTDIKWAAAPDLAAFGKFLT